VYVFHIDDHIVERKRRYNTGFEEWQEYYDLQWDVVELRRELFEKLRHTPDINVPFYNSEQDETANRTVVTPHDCIVNVEGVFLQRQEWRQFLDFVVYLDCLRATRFQRESTSTRQQIVKFQRRYWKAEDHYLAKANPLSSADMVINS
jgi:uridine kinase